MHKPLGRPALKKGGPRWQELGESSVAFGPATCETHMSKFSRVIIIAPTRSTCVNLQVLVSIDESTAPEAVTNTLLIRECGDELTAAITDLSTDGFGIVAGTGTGKSAAIRQICRDALGEKLTVGIVTLEHRASELPRRCNVVVITPGVAVQWAKSGRLDPKDLIILDEIHQTSEHLEFSMALLKRCGCTFVWMSATIDPSVYQGYFGTQRVIECTAFDPKRRAQVKHHPDTSPAAYLRSALPGLSHSQHGVAFFVPTRDEAQALAEEFNGQHGVYVDFYHGGEPAEKLRKFLEGKIPHPFVIVMTAAGASSLNLLGLTDVAIVDSQFKQVVRSGRAILVRTELDNNTILQMAGRVNGRVVGSRVDILSDREIDLHSLTPEAPEFKLGGDLEFLAMTSARAGVDARKLDLIGSFDHEAYTRVFKRLVSRGIIEVVDGSPRLTELGDQIERLPVNVAWGEIIVKAKQIGDKELLQTVCLTACCGELYSLVGRRLKRDPLKVFVDGSDHLTAYNIVALALRVHGELGTGKYKLFGRDFSRWCRNEGYASKEIRNIVYLFQSLYAQLDIELPEPADFVAVRKGESLHAMFVELLAAIQSMEYVKLQQHSRYGNVYGNMSNGASYGRSVLGAVRLWTDTNGFLRATIEGTEIPGDVVERYAQRVRPLPNSPHQYVVFAGEHIRTEYDALEVLARQQIGERSGISDKFLDLRNELRDRLDSPLFVRLPEGLIERTESLRSASLFAAPEVLKERASAMESLLSDIDAEFKQLRAEGRKLLPSALQLVERIGELIEDSRFTETWIDGLQKYCVAERNLPQDARTLQAWINNAKDAIASAEQYLKELPPDGGVSDDLFAALQGRFNRR